MVITNFSSGELSQNLKGRVDLPQYYSGCQRLENFEIIPTGGIRRRVGTERLGRLHGDCRLIPFIIDRNTSFVFEAVFIDSDSSVHDYSPHVRLYIWKNGAKMIGVNNEQIFIDTPWASLAEAREAQYAQNYDTMIFVQRDHRPLVVRFNMALGTFSYDLMEIDWTPDVSLDDDYGVVKTRDHNEGLPPDPTDGDLCVYLGRLWKYSAASGEWLPQGSDPDTDTGLFREPEQGETDGINDGKYPGCVAFWQNRLFLASTRRHPQRIWASSAPDTKGTRYSKFALYKKYVTVNKVTRNPDIHIFTGNILATNIDREHSIIIVTGVTQDLTAEGILEADISSYFVSNTSAIPTGTEVIAATQNTVTLRAPGFSLDEDATAVVFTISRWRNVEIASADDYEFKAVSSNIVPADCGFFFEPASDQNDAVMWLAPASYLAIGTETNVWGLSRDASALSVFCSLNGRYGSDSMQAHVVDTAVVFFAQGKMGIREHYYNAERSAFQTNNIAVLAEQMLSESPAFDFDFVTNPYNSLLITREDGTVARLLYDRSTGVMGWSRTVMSIGDIRSCAVVRGSGQFDIEYFCVRDSDGYYMERTDRNREVYLDSWSEYTGADSLSGYDAARAVIWNATSHRIWNVSEIGDMPAEFISRGDTVYIGYLYTSEIMSLPCVAKEVSAKKRIVNLHVRFLDSYMPAMKTTGRPDEFFTGTDEPFSGVKKIDYPGVSDIDVVFSLFISKPEPCNVLSVDAATA